jgi:hypothetical protein
MHGWQVNKLMGSAMASYYIDLLSCMFHDLAALVATVHVPTCTTTIRSFGQTMILCKDQG